MNFSGQAGSPWYYFLPGRFRAGLWTDINRYQLLRPLTYFTSRKLASGLKRIGFKKNDAVLVSTFYVSNIEAEIVETTFSFPKFWTVPGRFRFFYF